MKHADKAQRRWRSMLWSMVVVAALAMALPATGYVITAAFAQEQASFADRNSNPRADTWREARGGTSGFTAQSGPYVTDTLISNVGQNWRQARTGPLTTWGGWFLIGVVAAISLFFAVFGRQKLDGGRSGMTVPRWSAFERFVHWFVGISFVFLAVTGLSLLFGRTVLIPLLGGAGFAAYAQVAMNVHNFLGPAFAVGLLVMILMWVRENIPNRHDLEWFKQGGGLFGASKDGRHPPAGKLNAGEKVWFWGGVFVLGLVVSVTGLIMDFPALGFQSREAIALSQLIHAGGAMLWIGGFLGHAYIGTLGTEGALQGMTTGRVDVNWARQHHDQWYDDLVAKGERPEPEDPKQRPEPRPAA